MYRECIRSETVKYMRTNYKQTADVVLEHVPVPTQNAVFSERLR